MSNILNDVIFERISSFVPEINKGDLKKQFSNRLYFSEYPIPSGVFSVDTFDDNPGNYDFDKYDSVTLSGEQKKRGRKKKITPEFIEAEYPNDPSVQFRKCMRQQKSTTNTYEKAISSTEAVLRDKFPEEFAIPFVFQESGHGNKKKIDLIQELDSFVNEWSDLITEDIGTPFFDNLRQEMLLYKSIKEKITNADYSVRQQMALEELKKLLPAWLCKCTIGWYQGEFWCNRELLNILTVDICREMRRVGYAEDMINMYELKLRTAIDNYLENSYFDESLEDFSVVELYEIFSKSYEEAELQQFEKSFYVIFYDSINPSTGEGFFTNDDPIKWKSGLIWNIVFCSIFGPEHAEFKDELTDPDADIGLTYPLMSSKLAVGSGAFTITRLRESEEQEFSEMTSSGQIKVIDLDMYPSCERRVPIMLIGKMSDGSSDEHYHEGVFIVSDAKVSKRHAELYLVKGALHLSDLSSKNGTYVLRNSTQAAEGNVSQKIECFLFESRKNDLCLKLEKAMEGSSDEYEFVDCTGKPLALERGDLIYLPGNVVLRID